MLSKFQIQQIVLDNRIKVTEDKESGSQQVIVRKAAEEYGFKISDKEFDKMFTANFPSLDEIEYSGAVVQIEGNYTIPAVCRVETAEGLVKVHLDIYHQTLVNRRNRELIRELVEKKAVELFPGTDEEWLYEALSETSDEYFYETIREKAKGLPVYTVKFKEDGAFVVEEMDRV